MYLYRKLPARKLKIISRQLSRIGSFALFRFEIYFEHINILNIL